MSQMHCLYCEKPLPLLQRLRGDAEFCSKEHRRIYQKEHNQLALARLLQAQPGSHLAARPGDGLKEKVPAVQTPAAPPAKPEPVMQPARFVPDPPALWNISAALLTACEARWQPLRTQLPPGLAGSGRIFLGLGSFLRRETKAARPDATPASGRVRPRSLPFPRTTPRSEYLGQRPYRIDLGVAVSQVEVSPPS
ncbi:MAG: hypothetical protein ABIZ80_15155 [Bryobacteraceae bacterium]